MTAGRIILEMTNPALDHDANPIPNARLRFFETGTLIEHDVFTDSTLTTPLSNPVIADSAGRFAEIWGDTGQGYDVYWRDASNALIYPFTEIFPLAGDTVSGDGSGITDAAAFRDALGLGSAAVEDTGETDHTLPFLDGDNTFTGNNNFTAHLRYNDNQVGYLKIVPNQQDVDYTFVINDRGCGVWHGSASNHTYLLPKFATVAFSQGDTIYLRNTGAGVLTIQRDAGVVLRIDGAGADQDVDMASYGSATLVCDAQDVWNIAGSNLS